jgi:precorrin-6Y C5,15-methyltransferase (decarboxylating)
MALAAWRGRVWGIDKNPEAVALAKQNCAAFHLGNVTILEGGALEAFAALPAMDVVFLGGSGGTMKALIDLALEKNPHTRIVANAIALESVMAALEALEARGLETEVLQISAGVGRRVARLHMMTAQNPIFIVTGGAKA